MAITAQTLITQVRSTLVEPVQGFWTDNEILTWLTRGQSDYVNRTRILEDVDTSSTEAGIANYPLPQNCLSIRAMFINLALPGQSANWRRLLPSNLEKNAQQTPNFLAAGDGQTGDPASYMIWGREVYLFPVPATNGSDNLKLFFKAKPLELASVGQQIEMDDSLLEALVAYVLWKAFEKEKEYDQAQYQRSVYESYIAQGLRWAKKQSGDQRYRLDISSSTPIEGPFDNRFDPLA